MKEIVVISGKGGTGKTSLCASFAVLARSPVVADCDVDAADLHLILAPRVEERHEFRCGNTAVIRQEDCIGCGECLDICRYGAVEQRRACDPPCYIIDPVTCEGCGVCVRFCPAQAIEFPENKCGEWMVSETRCGPMVHARLAPAAENSGKLVSTVRREARRLAEERNRLQVIVDGPPGIGSRHRLSYRRLSGRCRYRADRIGGARSQARPRAGSPFRNPGGCLPEQMGPQPRGLRTHRKRSGADGRAPGRAHSLRPRRHPGADAGEGRRRNRYARGGGYPPHMECYQPKWRNINRWKQVN